MSAAESKVYLAVDIGASSGRVMAAIFDGTRIELEEVHRFHNGATEIDGEFHWDIHARFDAIKEGLSKARRKAVTYSAYLTHRSRRDYKK